MSLHPPLSDYITLRPVTPVGILARRITHAFTLATALEAHPDPDTAQDLFRELAQASELADGLEAYVAQCTTPPSEDLTAIAAATEAIDWAALRDGDDDGPALEAEMLSGHVEGQFLRFLTQMSRATRVLEIGLFTGYSALAIAEALPPIGRLVACELDPRVAALARRAFDRSEAGARIEIRLGPAQRTLADLIAAEQSFDLVFIDADKAGYDDYLDTLLDSDLLAADGTICVDNTLLQGEPWLSGRPSANGEAIAAFNHRLRADPRVEQVLVPLRDGVTLIRRAR